MLKNSVLLVLFLSSVLLDLSSARRYRKLSLARFSGDLDASELALEQKKLGEKSSRWKQIRTSLEGRNSNYVEDEVLNQIAQSEADRIADLDQIETANLDIIDNRAFAQVIDFTDKKKNVEGKAIKVCSDNFSTKKYKSLYEFKESCKPKAVNDFNKYGSGKKLGKNNNLVVVRIFAEDF